MMSAGLVIVTLGSDGVSSASTGGFILIGPVPIVFGTGGNGSELALLSVFLGAVMVVLVLLWTRSGALIRKGEEETDK